MQDAGDQLLAGTSLACDEHRRVGVSDAADGLVDLLHRGAVSDEGVGRVTLADERAELEYLVVEAAAVEVPLEGLSHLVDVERLGDVVVGAQSHRFDRDPGAAERGHHDDRQILIRIPVQLLQDIQPALVRHTDIHQDQVRHIRGVAHRLEHAVTGFRFPNCVAFVFQEVDQYLPDAGIIICDKNRLHRVRDCLVSCGAAYSRACRCQFRASV